MRAAWLIVAFFLALPTVLEAQSTANEVRDKALQAIAACLKRNEASSRECRNLNKDVSTLVDVYRQGDKSVLPTLLHFTYLTDFFNKALIDDPEGFLAAVSKLKEADQMAVASGISAGIDGIPQSRFDSIWVTLSAVPTTSSNYSVAQVCLKTLERNNAIYLVNYFPPQTFAGRAGDFERRWFSNDFYSLGHKPLWPAPAERTYRITVLPSFSAPLSAELKVLPDGTGQVEFGSAANIHWGPGEHTTRAITPQQVAGFIDAVQSNQFWETTTAPPPSDAGGKDGAEWILEGAENGNYHIVVRWCPEKKMFWKPARDLFHLAGHKLRGSCGIEH